MGKKVPAINISLPEQVENMTIGDLMRLPDTEINYSNNKFTARRKSSEGTTVLEFSQAPSGRKNMKLSSAPAPWKKSEYLPDILAMKAQGMKQKDIAYELGISPAYISVLLRGKN